MMDKTHAMRQAQINKVASRNQHIRRILDQMKRNKITPGTFTMISEYVSERLSEIEQKPCSASTLRRNHIYRDQIQSFMNEMGYRPSNDISSANQQVLSLQLRVRELERTNRAVEKNLIKALSNNTPQEQSNPNLALNASGQLPENISRICKIMFGMMKVLDAFDIDLSTGKVIDSVTLATMFDRDNFPEFFLWYEINKG